MAEDLIKLNAANARRLRGVLKERAPDAAITAQISRLVDVEKLAHTPADVLIERGQAEAAARYVDDGDLLAALQPPEAE